MAPRIISGEQVAKIMNWPMMIAAVEVALKSESHKTQLRDSSNMPFANQSINSITTCEDGSDYLTTMSGYISNYILENQRSEKIPTARKNTFICNLSTSFKNNIQRTPSLPNLLSHIFLFNTENGQLECIMDGTEIIPWKTAAASLVSTKYLYFQQFPNAGKDLKIKMAIIGIEKDGFTHARAFCATFDVSEIYLWSRTKSKAMSLAAVLKDEAPSTIVYVSNTLVEAVENADVICLTNTLESAIIEQSMLKKSRLHLITIDTEHALHRNIALDIYKNAQVFIDSWAAAKVHLAGFHAEIFGEINEVINGTLLNTSSITIFLSMGMTIGDATVAQAVLDEAELQCRCGNPKF